MKFLSIVLLATLPFAIFAQSNYHDGYVIKNNGDTLKGFIDNREWAQSPTSIHFKVNSDDKDVIKFDPRMIKSFTINGLETYVTYRGMITTDRTKFPNLPLGADTGKKLDIVFLKQIVTGKYLTLFYHQDEIKARLFIAEANSLPVELKFTQYYDSENKVIVKNNYRGQMLFYIDKYVPGNSKLNKQTEDLGYNQTDLETIVSEINGNTELVKKKPSFRLFAGAGIISTKSQLHDETHQIQTTRTESTITNVVIIPLSVTILSTTVSPKIDFGIDLFTNPDVQQLIFRAEMSLYVVKGNFPYAVFNPPTDTNVNSGYSFDQYSARLTPQILYNFYNKEKFKMYIDGGICLNYSVYGNNTLKAYGLNTYWTSLPIQVGVFINKQIEFSLAYTGYASLTDFLNGFNLKTNQQALGLSTCSAINNLTNLSFHF